MDPNRHLCNAIASSPGGTYISDIDSSTEFPPFLLSVSPFRKAVVYILLFKVKQNTFGAFIGSSFCFINKIDMFNCVNTSP